MRYKKGEAFVEAGFILVVRGGSYGQTLGRDVAVASKRFQQTGMAARCKKKDEAE